MDPSNAKQLVSFLLIVTKPVANIWSAGGGQELAASAISLDNCASLSCFSGYNVFPSDPISFSLKLKFANPGATHSSATLATLRYSVANVAPLQ